MSGPNTPRPNTPRPPSSNNNSEFSEYNEFPNSISAGNNDLVYSPATPYYGQEYDNSIREAIAEYNIVIPMYHYIIKGTPELTEEQRQLLQKMQRTATFINVDSFPLHKKGFYYTSKARNNSGFGFTLNNVRRLENSRKVQNGQQTKIKEYYTKNGNITPNQFHTEIPSATLINLDKYKLIQPNIFYDPMDLTRALTFDELVAKETNRINDFITLVSETSSGGGYRRMKHYKKTKKSRRGKRKTRRA